MTDHEMCLLAARAAGYTVEDRGTWIIRTVNGVTVPWVPLEDDGDAFRLMVDRGADVDDTGDGFRASVYGDTRIYDAFEFYGDDKHAATRRAIVRAAAMGASDAPL